MISEDQLKRVAAWSRELTPAEIEVARAGITERSYGTGETVFMRGDKFDYWAGMVSCGPPSRPSTGWPSCTPTVSVDHRAGLIEGDL